MTDALDTRARAAAAALHQSVGGLSVGSPRPQPAGGRLVLAAAAVLAVVAVGVSLRDPGDGDTDVATDIAGGVPRLVLDEVPRGLVPTGASDLPLADQRGVTTYWVYGDPGADNPFAHGDLGVMFATGYEEVIEPPEGVQPVEIDGRRAWVTADPDPVGRRVVAVELDSGSFGSLASSTLSEDQLLEAVGQLGLDGDGAPQPSEVGGLHLVATSSAGYIGSLPFPLPATHGHIVGYQSADDAGGQSVVVASVEGGEDASLVGRWALGPAAQRVGIRGGEGWTGSAFGGTSTLVLWRESPSNLVAVIADGLPDGAALAAASSLRPATDDEWAALLTAVADLGVPTDAVAAVSSDEQGGAAFAVYLAADGSLCLNVETSDGSAGTCSGGSGDSAPLVVLAQSVGEGGLVVYGYTTLGTNGELRITADGQPSSGGSEAFYEGGTLFGFTVADGLVPVEIVVQAADGTELGRAPVPSPGDHTGAATPTTRSG